MTTPVKRILIADDHDIIRRGVRMLISTRPNFRVVAEAATGREALKLAEETKPDIAILDYSLPELNGCDLTIKLRKLLPQIEVLIYTVHEREEVVLEVLQAGAHGLVLKSDTEKYLLAAIDALSVRRPFFSGAISEALLAQHFWSKPEQARGSLTHREREVVQLIAEGKINKQVAELLHISVKTVETHRATAMQKLKFKTTAELVRYAVRNRIVDP
jgi:DNA-binding NarL/FixJ family response regulator